MCCISLRKAEGKKGWSNPTEIKVASHYKGGLNPTITRDLHLISDSSDSSSPGLYSKPFSQPSCRPAGSISISVGNFWGDPTSIDVLAGALANHPLYAMRAFPAWILQHCIWKPGTKMYIREGMCLLPASL